MRLLLRCLLAALVLSVTACGPSDPGRLPDASALDALDAELLAVDVGKGEPDAGLVADGAIDGTAAADAEAVAPNDAAVADAEFMPADANPSCSGSYPAYAGPPDRYTGVETLRDSALESALRTIVSTGVKSLGYTGAKDAMFGANGFDVHAGEVECVYSGGLFLPSQLDSSGGFNTEHSWPQSKFSGDTASEKADMHHLFAAEQKINSCRGNNDYGDTDQPRASCTHGASALGPIIGGSAPVFQVRAERRGDIARAQFYFATRYGLPIPDAEETTLRCWHLQDPPDDLERARNDAIEALQHNRNPFVDRPEFVGDIANF